jgi:hypothetical protein
VKSGSQRFQKILRFRCVFGCGRRVEWECDLDEHRGVNLDSERECTAVRVMP